MTTCTTTEILQGPARMYVAAFGATPPADSVAYEGSWPAGWRYIGMTNSALTMTITQETNQIQPQQSSMDVKEVVTKRLVELSTDILEASFENLLLIAGGTLTQTAAASGQVGKDELAFGTGFNLLERAWGFEAPNGYGLVQRFIVRLATAKSNGAPAYDKDNVLIWPLMVHALDPCDGQEPINGLNVTAEALP